MLSLSPTATRELVHLFILRELGRLRRSATATVKGGVNLRLFFDSSRYSAVRQKLEALGGRREAQARDVFDIHVLIPDGPTDALLAYLSETVRRGSLEEAHTRALAISYSEYEGQVFEFLREEVRSDYATEGIWDEMRLRVAALIESVLKRQEQE